MKNKREYIWGVLSRFAPQIINLGTTMILARFLTPDDFGQIGVLSIIFIVANVLLDAGLGGSLIKEQYVSDIDCSTISVFNMLVSIFIYLLLFIFSGSLETFFNHEGLSNVICMISLVFPFSAFGLVPKALLNRKLQFRKAFWNSLFGVTVASIISIIIALLNGGVYALVANQVITVAVTGIANYISSQYKFSIKFSFLSLRKLLPFGLFTTIISIVDTIYENLMTALIGKYLNVQQAGYLYQAKRIEETMTTSLSTAINTVSFPILTRLKDDRDVFVREAESTLRTILCLTLPLLSFVSSFSEPIITALFGKEWNNSAPYLESLMFAGAFLIMESLIRNFIKSLCEVKQLLYVSLIKRSIGILILFVSLIFSPQIMIYAYILTSFLGYFANQLLYNKLIHYSILKSLVKIIGYAIPSLIYISIMKLSLVSSCTLLVRIVISISLMIFIYLVVLRFLGLSGSSLIKSIFTKK